MAEAYLVDAVRTRLDVVLGRRAAGQLAALGISDVGRSRPVVVFRSHVNHRDHYNTVPSSSL